MALLNRQVVLIGAIASGLMALGCLVDGRCRRRHSEEMLDEGLDETFPASDPTASQDFAIPVNRQ
jgi:hypothetical protein